MKITWMRGICALAILAAAGLAMLGAGQPVHAAEAGFSDVPASHWAYDKVMWAKENGVTDGYPDGTFRPAQPVTEAEFLGMLVRAYPEIVLDELPPGEDEAWFAPYYYLAMEMEWPVTHKSNLPITRGEVARLLAAFYGQTLSEDEAVQWVLNQGLAQGKTGGGVEGFAPGDELSRAEAQTFLYRLKLTLPKATSPDLIKPNIQLQGVEIGDTAARVVELLGEPVRKDVTNYGLEWYIYNKDYKHYTQVGIQGGRVVGLFGNHEEWRFEPDGEKGLEKLQTRLAALWDKSENPPRDYIETYTPRGLYVNLYLDEHENNRVDGVLLMDKMFVETNVYEPSTPESLKATEREIFDLTNAFRAQKGLNVLTWNEPVAEVARLHSKDMAERNYFEHDNPEGKSAGDRMMARGIGAFRAWGENIAAGYLDAIDGHYGWLNSLGHRHNLLEPAFTTLGVGVVDGLDSSDYDTYYTQNFYTPLN
ncbi:CAP domain-containing protein [Paenibacillus macerans]|uniref:CAP domain-containing protein n=1 Tax=Paenibacillus macerans TaxID=44252 RepID=UPI003D31DA2B